MFMEKTDDQVSAANMPEEFTRRDNGTGLSQTLTAHGDTQLALNSSASETIQSIIDKAHAEAYRIESNAEKYRENTNAKIMQLISALQDMYV